MNIFKTGSVLILIFSITLGQFLVLAPTSSAETITPVYPNDSYFHQQRAYYDMVKVPDAWTITTGNDDIVIAVIDTGIDMQHPDLTNNLWYNGDEIRHNGIDDDGNGYVDDYYGYDFSITSYNAIQDIDYNPGVYNLGTPDTISETLAEELETELCKELLDVLLAEYKKNYPEEDTAELENLIKNSGDAVCGYYFDENPNFNDDVIEQFGLSEDELIRSAYNNVLIKVYSTHGTPVSALIASKGNNINDFSGVLWNAKIMNLRVFELWKVHEEVVGGLPPATELKVAEAIRYAVDNDADVINMSLGWQATPQQAPYVESALKYAYENNVPVIVAAGNENANTDVVSAYPACSSYVLTVGAVATNANPKLAYKTGFSNYGSCIDVVAPGENIASLYHGYRLKERNPYDLTTPDEVIETRRWYFESGASRPFRYYDGTSFSAPIVAGIVGLLKSEYPNATPQEIYDRIKGTAIESLVSKNIGSGTVDAYKALTAGQLGQPGEVLGESTVDTSYIPEGALIRGQGDIDVWIVKYVGNKKFKRLVLSPTVFNSYGHLHWEDIMDVTQETVDAFTTSDLVRATVAGDPRVYKLYPQGDTGEKRWVTSEQIFNAHGWDWDSIYTINETDRDSYVEGSPFYQ